MPMFLLHLPVLDSSALVIFEALYLGAYQLQRFGFLKKCTERLQLTVSQFFDVRNVFTENFLSEKA